MECSHWLMINSNVLKNFNRKDAKYTQRRQELLALRL